MRQIVRHLRVVSKGDGEPDAVIDVRRALESSLEVASGWIKHRAAVVAKIGAHLPVRAGEAQLGRVFLNLLVNAAQAIPADDGRRHEIAVDGRLEGDRVVVEVRDTGVGIAPADLGRIFEPFFTTKPIGEGTGLGLSIAHGIVRSYGGEISVQSVPGRGTTFRVELPSAARPAAASPAEA